MSGIEVFKKAATVRLRSHHDKYLLAEDDKENVTQERDGTVRNAIWTVELIPSNATHIRLKSCYGRYLTASNMPMLLGMTGKKVLQTLPRRLDSSVEWEPIRDGIQVRLRTHYGQYLRANGGLPPWRNHVTHDVPHRTSTQDWILWNVDIVAFRKQDPPPPLPSIVPPPPPPVDRIDSAASDALSPTEFSLTGPRQMSRLESDDSFHGSPAAFEGRVINYEVIDDNGNVDGAIGERTFTFKGSGVEELKKMLKEEAGINENDDVHICSRNPLNGKLYPLRLHLPPNNAAMNIVVVPFSSKAATDLVVH